MIQYNSKKILLEYLRCCTSHCPPPVATTVQRHCFIFSKIAHQGADEALNTNSLTHFFFAAVNNDELTDVLKETNIAWSNLMELLSDTPLYVSRAILICSRKCFQNNLLLNFVMHTPKPNLTESCFCFNL